MPQIVESGRNDALGRAAGIAAGVINDQLAKQERQEKEAKRMALADREFEFRQDANERGNVLAGQRTKTFDQGMSEDEAASDFQDSRYAELGGDPIDLDGLSIENKTAAVDIYKYQGVLEGAKGLAQATIDFAVENYNNTNLPEGQAGPDEPPTQQQQMLEASMELAETPDDYARIAKLADEWANTAVSQRNEEIRIVAIADADLPLIQSLKEQLGAGSPDAAALDIANQKLRVGLITEEQYDDVMSSGKKAAREMRALYQKSKNSGGLGAGAETAVIKGMVEKILENDFDKELTSEEIIGRLKDLLGTDGRSGSSQPVPSGQGTAQTQATQADQQSIPGGQSSGNTKYPTSQNMKRFKLRRIFGVDKFGETMDAAPQIKNKKEQAAFIYEKLRVGAESRGLSSEQRADVVKSVMNLIAEKDRK